MRLFPYRSRRSRRSHSHRPAADQYVFRSPDRRHRGPCGPGGFFRYIVRGDPCSADYRRAGKRDNPPIYPSSASNPAPRTQVGANYVQFSNITAGSYTVDPAPPTADWAYVRACSRNLDNGTNAEGLSRNLPAGALLRWDIGYTLGTAWVQAQGGDVYSSGAIRSYIPAVTPWVFITDGTGGYPGGLMYGTSVDLDSDPFESGADLVSADNWQVNTSRASVNYYDYFYRRFGGYQALTTIPSTIRLLQLILTSS